MMSLKNTISPLFLSKSFPISSKPQTLHFPQKKTFRVQVTKYERLVARERDEAEKFYKTLIGKTKEERKEELEKWVQKKRKKIKGVKKWAPIVLGNVNGSDKWSIIKWMLNSIGIKYGDEEMEPKEEEIKEKKIKEKKIEIKEEKRNAKKEVVKTKEEEAKTEDEEEMKEQKEVEKFQRKSKEEEDEDDEKKKEDDKKKKEDDEKKREVEDLLLAAMVLEALRVATKKSLI